MTTAEEHQWGSLAHVIPMVVFMLTGMGWIGAFAIYWTQGKKSKFVAYQSLQALFFQFFIFALCVLGWLMLGILVGFGILAIAGLAAIAVPLLAGLAAGKGEDVEFPVIGPLSKRLAGY